MLNSHLLHRQRRRRGMTLLELVLALALSGLLLTAIGMALHIHWRAFDVKRSRVEEAQLASAILRSISDDIRSTLKFEPPNLEGLNLSSLTANAAASVVSGAMSGDGSDNGGDGGGSGNGGNQNGQQQPGQNNTGNPSSPMQGGAGGSQSQPGNTTGDGSGGGGTTGTDGGGSTGTGGGTSTGATSTGDTASGMTTEEGTTSESGPSVVVGLYGSATQLQFDISRLPRVDQYQMQEGEDGSVQIPSDIKTVVYYLAEDVAAADGAFAIPQAATPSATGAGRGLMRAESDRAVSAYGEVNGSTDSLYAGAKLLAAEVTSVQFQYFDGTEWLAEWNSDDQGGLPTAIEVLLTTGSSSTGQSNSLVPSASSLTSAVDTTTEPTYRMVVHLPVGGISPSTEESADTTAGTDTAATDTGGTNGADGGAMP